MQEALSDRLGINDFFVTSENLGIRIWRKRCVNYDKIEIAQDCVNQIFNPNAFFFILYIYLHILHHLQAKKMIFKVISNLHVQRCKLYGKIVKFGGKSFKKFNSEEFMDFVFSKSGYTGSVKYQKAVFVP